MKKIAAVALFLVVVSLFAQNHNILSLSLGDLYALGRGPEKMDSPEAIELGIRTWKEMFGIEYVNWRFNDDQMDNFVISTKGYNGWQDREYRAMKQRFDDNAVGLEVSHRLGLKFILNFTFNDGGWPEIVDGYRGVYYVFQDKTLIEHPELQEVDRNGAYHWGYLDLSNPAARKHAIDRIVHYVTKLHADGLYLNTRSHSGVYSSHPKYTPGPHHADRFGFGKNLVAEYKRRYGIDILKDPRFDCNSPEFAPQSAEVENWRKLRGEYFLTLYKEVREALGKDKILFLGLPLGNYMGSSGGNIYVDHEKIITSGIADGIVLGISSGYVPSNLQRKLGYLSSEATEANYNVPTFDEYLKKYGELATKNHVKLFSNQTSVYRKSDSAKIAATPHHEGIAIHLLTLMPHPILSDSPSLRPTSGVFSLETMAMPFKSHEPGCLLDKYDHRVPRDQGRGWELRFMLDDSKKLRACLRVNMTFTEGGKRKQRDFQMLSAKEIAYDEWVYIGGTVDMEKHELRLYVNGRQDGRLEIPADAVMTQNSTTDFIIGCYSGTRTVAFTGLVDMARVSHAALPDDGRIPSYTGNEAGTVVLYRFDGTVKPIVKPSDSTFDFVGLETYDAGFKGGKALHYAKGAL